jgi:hypothetical protein
MCAPRPVQPLVRLHPFAATTLAPTRSLVWAASANDALAPTAHVPQTGLRSIGACRPTPASKTYAVRTTHTTAPAPQPFRETVSRPPTMPDTTLANNRGSLARCPGNPLRPEHRTRRLHCVA